MSNWIPIFDEQPSYSQWIIVYDSNQAYSARFPYRLMQVHEDSLKYLKESDFIITHWFPLPKGPDE